MRSIVRPSSRRSSSDVTFPRAASCRPAPRASTRGSPAIPMIPGGRASCSLRRVELYRRVEQLVLDDAPLIPMMHHTYERLFQPYVRSVEVNGLGDPYIPLRKVWLEPRR